MNYNDFVGKLKTNDKLNIDVYEDPKKTSRNYIQFDCRCRAGGRIFHNELALEPDPEKENGCIYIETHFVDGFHKYGDYLLGISDAFKEIKGSGGERWIRYDKRIACRFNSNGEIDISSQELDMLLDRIIDYKRLTDDLLWRIFELIVRH